MTVAMMPKHIVFTLSILLCACQTTSDSAVSSGPDTMTEGTMLVLKQQISIPTRRNAIYIQNGAIVRSWLTVGKVYAGPFCKLVANRRGREVQDIQPDAFYVRGVKHSREVLDEERTNYITKMALSSFNQPHVTEMTCGHWALDFDGAYLGIAAIQNTLGTVFTVQVANTVAE